MRSHYNDQSRLSVAEFYDRKEIIDYFIRHLRHVNLQRSGETPTDVHDKVFNRNEDFWNAILSSPLQGMNLNWIELDDFQIIDWFPRSPGLYHTYEAKEARKTAQVRIREKEEAIIYTPEGKQSMVKGGIGTVRFKPLRIENEESLLCTATSNGYCDSGIPLAIPLYLLRKIDFAFDYSYKIRGQVKFLPSFLEDYFKGWTRIPQIYVYVDAFERMNLVESLAVVTPMVFFTSERYSATYFQENEAELVTYVNCIPESVQEIDRAADWIAEYVREYNGQVITNFDQQRPTFENAPFSLQNIMDFRIKVDDLERFKIYHADIICTNIENIKTEVTHMTDISVTLGDGITIYGDLVVANKIKDSFNKADTSNTSDELKGLLKNLATTVGKMSEQLPKEKAEQVANDLLALTNEATSESPRRRWWELSLDGIREAARAVGDIGTPVLTVIEKLLPILVG
jgi:hypothetical protein